MSRSPKSRPTLDHLRSSPVRGQLEPYDPRTPKGWRYLQTTDTLDQLKVLLPPSTASMYDEILRLESVELAKKTQVNWARVLEIRHLKDRMIRKSQRLSGDPPNMKRLNRGESFIFQTLVAPSDFRLKEMEKWLRRNHPKLQATPAASSHHAHAHAHTHTMRHKASSCCVRCSRVVYASPSRAGSSASLHTRSFKSEDKPKPVPPPVPSKEPRVSVSGSSTPLPGRSTPDLPPLPHPLRNFTTRENASVISLVPIREESHDGSPQALTSKDVSSVDTLVQAQEEKKAPERPSSIMTDDLRPTLSRRRSCLKRSGIADAAKTVSWAADLNWEEQIAKYTAAAQEALESGQKWDELRLDYVAQVSKLDDLHRVVEDCLERLRTETEHFRKVDETIQSQRDALQKTFLELEEKQDTFLSNVHHVLDEVTRTMTLSGEKKATPETS